MNFFSKFLLFLTILFIFTGCQKKPNSNLTILNDEDVVDGSALIFGSDGGIKQSENPLLSNYSEGVSDGYSWRMRTITYDLNNINLTKEKLVSTLWIANLVGENSLSYGVQLVFYLDDVFKAGFEQTGVCIQGTYEIIDNTKVCLNIKKRDKNVNFPYFGELLNINLVFKKDIQQLFYTDFLLDEDNSVNWYALGSKHKENDKYKINDISVVSVFNNFVAIDNVKIRELPTLEAKTIFRNDYDDIDSSTKIDFHKKGTRLFTIARTEEKAVIDGISDYWYLTRVDDFHNDLLGWSFGRYFELYNEENEELEEYQ